MAKTLYIYGIHPVLETISVSPKEIKKIWVKKTSTQKEMNKIVAIAHRAQIPVEICMNDAPFRERVRDAVHQGVMAEINPPKMLMLGDFLKTLDKTKNPSLVILDELTDPHNVGAVIRSACALGVSGVLIPKDNQAGITGAVYKTSAGTVTQIPLVQIGNINQTLRTLKDEGFWTYGLSEKATTSLSEITFDSPSVFIIGNEEHGIAQKTTEICDILVRIPMKSGVDSLNASVSSAVLIWEWSKQNFI
ncbi:MAG: 23S rRNA (guanosine(2251)-2'-O)-methyltransferase RlmB [bacterium]